MSIPLDRLYHYLEGLSSSNILIYHWYPHGSKNPGDLIPLVKPVDDCNKQVERMFSPVMICHDQEPLDYEYYNKDNLSDALINKLKWIKQNKKIIDLYVAYHIRCLTFEVNFNEYTLLCHSEKNSKHLEAYEKNKFIGVYYWAHALIALDWFRYAKHDVLTTNYDLNQFNSDFLIYNRAWSGSREYRLKFVELLIENSLLENCNTKFSAVDGGMHYSQHTFKNSNFELSRFGFETLIQCNQTPSSASATYDINDYCSSAIEIVLETLFDDTRHHLTEKILRPIACGKPFILASTPGSLAYLKSYGFKTFNNYINETYDDIIDPLERLQAIIAEMKRLSLMSPDEKQRLWKDLHMIAAYNKKLFFSKKFHQTVISEYINNLTLGIEKCKNKFSIERYKLLSDENFVNNVNASIQPKFYQDILEIANSRVTKDLLQ